MCVDTIRREFTNDVAQVLWRVVPTAQRLAFPAYKRGLPQLPDVWPSDAGYNHPILVDLRTTLYGLRTWVMQTPIPGEEQLSDPLGDSVRWEFVELGPVLLRESFADGLKRLPVTDAPLGVAEGIYLALTYPGFGDAGLLLDLPHRPEYAAVPRHTGGRLAFTEVRRDEDVDDIRIPVKLRS